MDVFLRVTGLEKRFGGLVAVKGLGFEIGRGEIIGLIGPNGAGKSTAFNLISGALKPTAGRVEFDGRDVTGLPSSRIVSAGLVRTFQSTVTFAGQTVARNVENALLARTRNTLPQLLGGRRTGLLSGQAIAAEVDRILEIVDLVTWRDAVAGALPYGLQKKLGIAIALGARPSMLLLDEPAAGLNHEECNELIRLLRRLRDRERLSILLVEHHMAVVMEVCERIVVLVNGEKIAEGPPSQIRADPAVQEAYLGAPDYAHA